MESPYQEGLTLADRLASVQSMAQIGAFEREPHTHIRASIAGAALLAAMICFPAWAQSAQPASQDGIPNIPATGPAGWFWTLEEWRPTLSSSDRRFTMSLRARFQFDGG